MLNRPNENWGSLLGLSAISASVLIVEIALTKFIGFKLFHHMTYAVLSVVIMSFGAAGVMTYMGPKLLGFEGERPWVSTGWFAVAYAVALGLLVPAFCFCPLNPYDASASAFSRAVAMPVLFFILSLPFVPAGICVSQTLSMSKRSVAMIYFLDLLAAALGAAACPALLSIVGGYGTIAIAAGLGLVAAVGYWLCDGGKVGSKQAIGMVAGVAATVVCLAYPSFAISRYGIDILAFKEAGPQIVIDEFGGVAHTYWNAIARVDVSKTASSRSPVFRYGLPLDSYSEPIIGRYILLDGGANTRQFRQDRPRPDHDYFGRAIWSSPYIGLPEAKNVLVIGAGGGIDVLIGKYFHIPKMTLVEINPATCKLLTGEVDDPNREYSRWLTSDDLTKVEVHCDEARHFCATATPGSFDLIQASGVDTLTAIQTGGMSLVENYLYTIDAVKDYMRLLKPRGILSLTHWRTNTPGTALRMFTTYLSYLDSVGVQKPWEHVMVIGDNLWTDSMLSAEPFTEEQLTKWRHFAVNCRYDTLFDPGFLNIDRQRLLSPLQQRYAAVAFADAQERQKVFSRLSDLPLPVTDDKPYFYSVRTNIPDIVTLTNKYIHDPFYYWTQLNCQGLPLSLLASMTLLGGLLVAAPLLKIGRAQITRTVVWFALYFAVAGFAFLLYETSLIQMLHLFVGGPTYALTVVLVAVLAGYSLGGWLSSRYKPHRKLFMGFAFFLLTLFVGLYLCLPPATAYLLPLSLPVRLAVSGLLTLCISAAVGVVVTTAMAFVRATSGPVVAWMWGISSVFNALGSLYFVAIVQVIGISACMLVVAFLYAAANIVFAFAVPMND
jgi:spermidine synthase